MLTAQDALLRLQEGNRHFISNLAANGTQQKKSTPFNLPYATLEELRLPTNIQSPNLSSIVSPARPAVEELSITSEPLAGELFIEAAVRANIRQSVKENLMTAFVLASLKAGGAAEAASKIVGVPKVLVADVPYFEDGLAENVAEQILAITNAR